MSEVREEFDADAEEALDALLAQHQSSLMSTVGPALDVAAGLRRTSSRAPFVTSYEVDLRDSHVAWLIARDACTWPESDPYDFRVSLVNRVSSSLNGVLDAIRHEIEELETFARRISEQSAAAGRPAESEAPPVEVAVLRARDELDRILELLFAGGITKESAISEFSLAVRLLEEQRVSWLAMDAQDEPLWDVTWMEESISVRLGGLRWLREQVVRLFEDCNTDAFQLS
ncbi:hypothetical protein ACFV0D_01725 [Streptomyces sp. NPDC059556]|uniref:hypothetical protein n=1 Tax=Streptomyces sp. NPDC059556 TaxID=3346863 RepID=UPI0036AA2F56